MSALENRTMIEGQVAASEELRALVVAIEKQFDEAAASAQSTLAEGDLPTADELGAELERFLAEQTRPDQPPS